MVPQVPAEQPTNHNATTPSRVGSSSVNILMADSIDLTTWAKSYDKQPEGEPFTNVYSWSVPQSNGLLTLDKPAFDALLRPSKGALHRTTHNLYARVAQHYNIIEDISQASCAMSALEVLQSFPAQWKALLNAIGGIDSYDESVFFFTKKIVNCASPTPSLSIFMYVVWERMFITRCWMKASLPVSCLILAGRL